MTDLYRQGVFADSAKRSVLVVETSSAGHRLEYVRLIAELAAEHGASIELATTAAVIESEEYERELRTRANVRAHAVLEPGKSLRVQLVNTWRSLRRAAAGSSVLVIPNIDEKLVALALFHPLFRRVDVRGIVMRPVDSSETRPPKLRLKAALISWLRGRGEGILDLVSPIALASDVTAGTYIVDPSGLLGTFSADVPMNEAGRSLEEWKSSASTPVLGILGMLNDRKCVEEILRAAIDTRAFRLVIAGKPSSPEFGERLVELAQTLGAQGAFLLPRGLSARELEGCVRSCDVLSLAYRNERGSSGFLMHAVRNGIPVLGFRNETVNEAIARLHLGAILAGLDVNEVSRGVLEAAGTTVGRVAFQDIASLCRSQWRALSLPDGRGYSGSSGRISMSRATQPTRRPTI